MSTDDLRPLADDIEDNQRDAVVSQNDSSYRMDHPRRGVAALFNIRNFDNSSHAERRGSERDVESLRTTFSKLGFEVELFAEFTLSRLEATLEDLRTRNHSDCDCFALVFMSHGLEGKLCTRDNMFDVNLLWDPFTAERCLTLANKPKLFFVQACQGHDRQKGVLVSKPEDQSSGTTRSYTKLIPSYMLPDSADFLISLSTIPGFVSWRSPVHGSWYIQTLCQQLNCHGYNENLLTILTDVGRTVALEYSNFDSSRVCTKQLPSFISMLIRSVKFTKKKRVCSRSRKRKIENELDDDDDDGESVGESEPKRQRIQGYSR